MARARRHQAGFTLIEVMIVVALVAVLAAIALPAYWGSTRKAKADSEVAPYFNDLRTRLDQFAQENGTYPASLGESGLCPTSPSTTKQSIYTCSNAAAWQALKVRISNSEMVHCGYTWITGLPNDGANIGSEATAFGFTAPATHWYYLLARCNLDGDAANDSYFFSSSIDPTIRKRNPGH